VTSNSITTSPVSADDEIDPIRVELLSTEMPIHQLAKQGGEEIRILTRNRDGRVKLQWRVDYNPSVGRPGQLAYRLDTWVINRRLNALRRPLPRLVRIGDLREIARELKHGGDTNAVRQAFEQNVTTFIRAKVTYRTRGKGKETLEGYFNRYSVFYRGNPLPGGGRAETVYIGLNDPYYDLLNRSEIRPLNYAYLRRLTPAAQRFYELLSPKVFAALRNGYPVAWIRYSEYCRYAVQKRQPTRGRMQAQLARVHGPHRKSGYIATVTYRPSQSHDGSKDWIIEYEPGPTARAEYRFFNGPKRPRRRSQAIADGSIVGSDRKRPAESARTRNSARSVCDPARKLARRFAERRYRAASAIDPTPRQVACARRILQTVGDDIGIADAAVELAAAEGCHAKNGFPGDIAGVIEGGYLDRARGECERRQTAEHEVQAQRDRESRAKYEQWRHRRSANRIASLSHVERRRVVEERHTTFAANNGYLEALPLGGDRKSAWIENRILGAYGHEGEPTYEEWRREYDSEPST
jgi:hypothetical protein